MSENTSILRRLLSFLLSVLMLLGAVPYNLVGEIREVYAIPITTVGTSGTIGRGGGPNKQGGVQRADGLYYPTFRVSIIREGDAYYDGSQESLNKMISYYSNRRPNINTHTDSLLFMQKDTVNGSGSLWGLGEYVQASTNLQWKSTSYEHRQNLKIARRNVAVPASLNRAKIAMQADGYGKDGVGGKGLSALRDGKWRRYAMDDKINKAQALAIWEYIFTHKNNQFEVSERLHSVVSHHYDMANSDEWTDAQKEDIAVGYTGVLISLYKIAAAQGLVEIAGTFNQAIEDYIAIREITEKPVSLVIDTAVPIGSHTEAGSKFLNVISYDYLEYSALIPADASVITAGDIMSAPQKGSTKQQLIYGANASIKNHPVDKAKQWSSNIYRIIDGNVRGTVKQAEIQRTALGWGQAIPGFNFINQKSWHGDGRFISWSSGLRGFMDVITFDKEIKGFMIITPQLRDETYTVDFSADVDTTVKMMESEDDCEGRVYMAQDTPPQMNFKVLADSTAISALEGKIARGEVEGLKLEGRVSRKVWVKGVPIPALDSDDVEEFTREIEKEFTPAETIELLKGKAIVMKDDALVEAISESVYDTIMTRKLKEKITLKVAYKIEDFKYTLASAEGEVAWDDMVTRVGDVKMNYVEYSSKPFLYGPDSVEVIEVPQPSGPTDLNAPNPKENYADSTMVSVYEYGTESEFFAEVKHNTPDDEKYEAMAGIPSTEKIYFSAGGSEYMVAIVMQYWMNEQAVDRTYQVKYAGVPCEHKDADNAKTQSLGGHTVQLHNGGTYTKTWTGSIPNNASAVTATHSASCPAQPDRTAYNADKAAAVAYAAEVNATVLSHTSTSDRITRSSSAWGAAITTDNPVDPVSTSASVGCSYSPGSEGSPGTPCGVEQATANPSGPGSYTITVTFKVPAHIICGPCCQHDLPAVQDTWKQGIFYDYARISQVRLYKIDQASVTGLTELTGMDEIFASIKTGDPTHFMNIAQLTARQNPNYPSNNNTAIIRPFLAEGMSYGNIAGLGGTRGHLNTLSSIADVTTNTNRNMAQTSKAGRLRYTVEPQMHDVVVWDEGNRTNTCDGLGKTGPNNVTQAGGKGHDATQPWAKGILYTNNTYSNEYNKHMRRDNLKDKNGYTNQADDVDITTPEWKKFDEKRRLKNVATVISDFLILQTSGGDRSVFYFEKNSESVETQQHFPKVEVDEEEMFTNNPNSVWNKFEHCPTEEQKIVKPDRELFIPTGGYNGLYNRPNDKHRPYDRISKSVVPVHGNHINTILDNDPAGTIRRPPRNGRMLLMEDRIQIKPTAINRVYTPTSASVFYKQMVAYWTNDLDRKDTKGDHVIVFQDVELGAEARRQVESNKAKWGDYIGIQYITKYARGGQEKINDVVVFSPVTTENATILPLDDLDINGQKVSRDQRVPGFDVPDLTDKMNKAQVCPLDPGLCEHRVLNCKYTHDIKLADFDFNSTYIAKEEKVVNGETVEVEVTRPNTFQRGSAWVTTNKVNGMEYTLPTGFTIGTGRVGSGGHLNAFGTRWSIPFSEIGLANDPNNRVYIEMDLLVESTGPNGTMVVSFFGYDFLIPSGSTSGVFDTGNGVTGEKGGGLVGGTITGRPIKLGLTMSMNNVMDSQATIDGVVRPVTFRKRELGSTKVINSYTDGPVDLSRADIGNTINIGSWGRNNNHPARFYMDNLSIWLKGGEMEHTSVCYKTIGKEKKEPGHKHTADCLDIPALESMGGVKAGEIVFQSGVVQAHTVDLKRGKYKVEVWGGKGGNGYAQGPGGNGGYSVGVLTLTSDQNIHAYIGGEGGTHVNGTAGGFNGGGTGNGTSGAWGGGGGGGTDIRVGGTALSNRVIVAGGGGGGGHNGTGGHLGGVGGGTVGGVGGAGSPAGTQTSGFALGVGQNSYGHDMGAGGGGYYGGNASTTADRGGSGGSGYIGGVTSEGEVTARTIAGNQSMPNPTGAGNITGKTGNGYVKITAISGGGELGGYEAEDLFGSNWEEYIDGAGGSMENGESETFNYTGGVQTFTAPTSGIYTLETWGAAGGNSGGRGGHAKGDIELNKGDIVRIYVGGQGNTSTGGYNGGGGNFNGYGTGGGATDMRRGGTALGNRVIVAGGGAGKSHTGSAGHGGGTTGLTSTLGQGQSATGHHGGGGGGGYFGGAGGSGCAGVSYGGSSYVTGLSNTSMTAGSRVGNGMARITAKDVKGNIDIEKIKEDVAKFPTTMPDGKPNPIFKCGGRPNNTMVGTGQFTTSKLLNCTEPHHQGGHYDGANRLCWEACGDNDKHVIAKPQVVLPDGKEVPNARFLQLDEAFTVYFPNKGNFRGNDAHGIEAIQPQTGKGYRNNMDTTTWTREKRVKFNFDVIYEGEMHVANRWIELRVAQEYFDFYIPVHNVEASNSRVEFEVEAINGGVVGNPDLAYPTSVDGSYGPKLDAFRNSLNTRWLQSIRGTGSGRGYLPHTSTEYGYKDYFDWKKSQFNTHLTGTKNTINTTIWNAFNGATGINERAKPVTTNDNMNMQSNKKRSSSMEHLHGGYKYFYIDVIGRIGNMTLLDTEDYRYSNFFKTPKISPPDWMIEGLVYNVEEGLQNYYIGDEYDIRGNKISKNTRWLNTYGTQNYLQGTVYSGRNVNDPNVVTKTLEGKLNTVEQLQNEQMRVGYNMYTSIVTLGSYQLGNLLVAPEYYLLEKSTGKFIPADVYIAKDGIYKPVNLHDNTINGQAKEEVYDYMVNLDWTKESKRRNYTIQEQFTTEKVAEFYETKIYDYSAYDEYMPPTFEDLLNNPPALVQKIDYYQPRGKTNYMGNAQALVLNGKHRTFVGSSQTYGNNTETAKWGVEKNPGGFINDSLFAAGVQRWHYKLGLPSSSVLVKKGQKPTQLNVDEAMDNEKYALVMAVTTYAQGDVWTLEYKQPWQKEVEVEGVKYPKPDNIPVIIAIQSSEDTAVMDVQTNKTH